MSNRAVSPEPAQRHGRALRSHLGANIKLAGAVEAARLTVLAKVEVMRVEKDHERERNERSHPGFAPHVHSHIKLIATRPIGATERQ